MKVQEIMTQDCACCTRDTKLQDVARLMVQNDCGAIPVIEDSSNRIIGILTDRDIVLRSIAAGKNPMDLTAADCMTTNVYVCEMNSDVQDCCKTMEEHCVRRIPVVDDNRACRGIVAQADIARECPDPVVAEVLKEVSQPVRVAGGR